MMGTQALEGIKVADFTAYLAGPILTKALAWHGAMVIKVESNLHMDGNRANPPFKTDKRIGPNQSGFFATLNSNKYGITINLRQPQGVEIARRLIQWSDIVVENFAGGVMERLGLGYEELKKIKPEIIMMRSSNQGQTGPRSQHRGFGLQLESLAGLVHLTGWPDRPPVVTGGPTTDVIGARFGLVAVLAALAHRNRTGRGQCIDLSQYEASLYFMAPALLDFMVNRRSASRVGNRCAFASPHGIYPCQGEDRWCAITVFSDEEWEALRQAMGNPSWTLDFASLVARKQNEDRLDERLGQWTSSFVAEELAMMLQSRGVSAGVVKTNREVLMDPQLAYRQQWQELDHPELGRNRYDKPGFQLSRTPAEASRAAPCLGEHNEFVYTQVLGMKDEEFVEIVNSGAIK